jgi:Gas vesicle protein
MAERAEPTLYNRREVDPRQMQVQRGGGPANLADILERVLDKGIVIAGDIQINLFDIELLTIKLRLLIASVERAQEMGINWWESDPTLSSSANELEEENRDLRSRLERLEKAAGLPAPREGEEVILEEHRREEIVQGEGVEREEREEAQAETRSEEREDRG